MNNVLEAIGVGQTVELLIARRGKLTTRQMELELEPKQDWKIKRIDDPSEAQAAALLKHANIVSVYSVGCQRGVHYYAMEYPRSG